MWSKFVFVIVQEIPRIVSLVYALHSHVDSGIDVLDCGMSAIVVAFGVWILLISTGVDCFIFNAE